MCIQNRWLSFCGAVIKGEIDNCLASYPKTIVKTGLLLVIEYLMAVYVTVTVCIHGRIGTLPNGDLYISSF